MHNDYKILALIPARAGSKRVPYKNIRDLCGKPLMQWSVDFAFDSKLFDPVVVSTDSREYAMMAEDWGAWPIMRPQEFASDYAGDFEVIRHCLFLHDCNLVAYLRPTTPFRDAQVVKEAIEFMLEKGASSLRSVERMKESAFKCFTMNCGFLNPITEKDQTDLPNQAVEQTFHPNGYIDLTRTENIKRGLLWGARKAGFMTPAVPEIDTEEDFEYAKWWYERRKNENR